MYCIQHIAQMCNMLTPFNALTLLVCTNIQFSVKTALPTWESIVLATELLLYNNSHNNIKFVNKIASYPTITKPKWLFRVTVIMTKSIVLQTTTVTLSEKYRITSVKRTKEQEILVQHRPSSVLFTASERQL